MYTDGVEWFELTYKMAGGRYSLNWKSTPPAARLTLMADHSPLRVRKREAGHRCELIACSGEARPSRLSLLPYASIAYRPRWPLSIPAS